MLRAIVRRARLLLRADVAYMTVPDPAAKDTYMRVTSGSVSAAFQQVRLGLGEGLGGLVAQRAAPYATAGYFGDERFLHTGPIDHAVREEGLVAILGVPLLLGGSVIGVLFAADRRHRTFGPEEVSLLSSMAAHAAIAIDAANLLDETRTALAELNAANELVKGHSAAVERAARAHHRFTELVLAGGGAEHVAQAVSEVLGRDVSILSEQDTPIAASGDAPLPDAATLSAVAEARAARRAVCAGERWAVPATAGSEHLGTLVLRAGPDLPEADRLILERAAMVSALLLLMRRSVTEAEHRLRGDLLSDLLSAPHLSGGQQQMLAIGRVLLHERPLLLVDEPSKGLSPRFAGEMADALERASTASTILMVEQNVHVVRRLARHMAVMDRGQVVYTGAAAELDDEDLVRRLLGVAGAA